MALCHQDEIVGKPSHLVGRVRHVENRDLEFIPELFEPGENFALSRKVERCEGLVHEKNVGPQAERPCNGAALTFAPGEF